MIEEIGVKQETSSLMTFIKKHSMISDHQSYSMNDFHSDLLKIMQTHTQPRLLSENDMDKAQQEKLLAIRAEQRRNFYKAKLISPAEVLKPMAPVKKPGTSSKLKLVDRDKRQRVMKEMLKTLGEQAEREKAAESYIDSLFSNIAKVAQPPPLKDRINETAVTSPKQNKRDMCEQAGGRIVLRLLQGMVRESIDKYLEIQLVEKAVATTMKKVIEENVIDAKISLASEPKRNQSPLFLLSPNNNVHNNDELVEDASSIKTPSQNKLSTFEEFHHENQSPINFENYQQKHKQQEESLICDQAIDLLFRRLFNQEEFNNACQKANDSAIDKIADKAVMKTQKEVIQGLFEVAIDQEQFLYQDQMLDKLVNRALSRVIQRIIHEMVCLYNIDTAFKTADNVIMNHLMPHLLIEIIHDGCADDFLKLNDSPSSLRPLAPTLSTSPSKVIDIQIPLYKLPKNKFVKVNQNNTNAISNSPPKVIFMNEKKGDSDQKAKRKQKLNYQFINNPNHNQDGYFQIQRKKYLDLHNNGRSQSLLGQNVSTITYPSKQTQVDEYLDLDFFQKCFFGRKLHNKDQLIFKIYAKELFDIIERKVNKKQISFARRKKSLPLATTTNTFIRVNKRQAERIQHAQMFENEHLQPRSKSPISSEYWLDYQSNLSRKRAVTPNSQTITNRQNQQQPLVLLTTDQNQTNETLSADGGRSEMYGTKDDRNMIVIQEQRQVKRSPSQNNPLMHPKFNEEGTLIDNNNELKILCNDLGEGLCKTTNDRRRTQKSTPPLSKELQLVAHELETGGTGSHQSRVELVGQGIGAGQLGLIRSLSRKKKQPNQQRDQNTEETSQFSFSPRNEISQIQMEYHLPSQSNYQLGHIRPQSSSKYQKTRQQIQVYQNLETQIKDILSKKVKNNLKKHRSKRMIIGGTVVNSPKFQGPTSPLNSTQMQAFINGSFGHIPSQTQLVYLANNGRESGKYLRNQVSQMNSQLFIDTSQGDISQGNQDFVRPLLNNESMPSYKQQHKQSSQRSQQQQWLQLENDKIKKKAIQMSRSVLGNRFLNQTQVQQPQQQMQHTHSISNGEEQHYSTFQKQQMPQGSFINKRIHLGEPLQLQQVRLHKKLDNFSNTQVIKAYMMRAISPSLHQIQQIVKVSKKNNGTKGSKSPARRNHDLNLQSVGANHQ